MTPEQRLDRLERVVKLIVNAGWRSRKQLREQDEKINILITTQIETGEQIRGLATGQAELARSQQLLARSQQLTDQALRAFINSLRKGRNEES